MDEKKRQEIALKRGFEQNAAADFRSVCEQPIDIPIKSRLVCKFLSYQ